MGSEFQDTENAEFSDFDLVYHCRDILNSVLVVFRMSLWNYETVVMDALLELIVSLAAPNGKYVDLCLEMLVNNFMPPYHFLDLLKQPRGLDKKDQVLSHVHAALKDIAGLVPLAPLRLCPIVIQRMPNVFSKEPHR